MTDRSTGFAITFATEDALVRGAGPGGNAAPAAEFSVAVDSFVAAVAPEDVTARALAAFIACGGGVRNVPSIFTVWSPTVIVRGERLS